MGKKVLLIQGGMGAERSVSLNTGKAFESALKKLGYVYDVVDAVDNLPQVIAEKKPDVVLNALHGKFGEDGTVQGVCEYLKIPYSGSGLLASAMAMNKVVTKEVLMPKGIPSAEYFVIDMRTARRVTIQTKLDFPIVVKPAREGSSVGVSICKSEKDFMPAVEKAAQHDYIILCERFIDGPEVTVPLFCGKSLTPIEVVPHDEFYDFEHKYTKGKTDYIMPARLAPEVLQDCRKISELVYKIMDIRTYARIDFRVEKGIKPLLMEVNTLPGCTETSLLPKAAAHEGIPFEQIVKELVESATLDYAGVR